MNPEHKSYIHRKNYPFGVLDPSCLNDAQQHALHEFGYWMEALEMDLELMDLVEVAEAYL